MDSELTEPLDVDNLPEKLRAYAYRFIDLLSNLDSIDLTTHTVVVRTAPTGILDAEHFGEPAMISMLARGNDGLNAIYELAENDDFWFAASVLMAVARSDSDFLLRHSALAKRYINEEVYNRVFRRSIVQAGSLSTVAKGHLTMLVSRMVSDPKKHSRLGLLMMTGNASVSSTLDGLTDSEFIIGCISKAVIKVNDIILRELQDLISQDLPERTYQDYFERHPELIDPLATQVIPQQALAEKWRTDFVVRRLDDEYIFVEIEKPQDLVMSDYPRPTASLSHAIGQIMNWFSWVEDNIAYAQSHYFPNINSPRGVVIIGRYADMNVDQRRALRQLNSILAPRVVILTYDDVLTYARNIVKNISNS